MNKAPIKKSASGNLLTEYSDLVSQDLTTSITGKTTLATIPIANDIKHITVTGYVMNIERTKLLMIHHNKMDKWLPPGGHLEAGELPHKGALREVFEETGIHATMVDLDEHNLELKDISDTQVPRPYALIHVTMPATEENETHIDLDMIFACEADEYAELTLQLDEVSEVQWLAKEEILSFVETFDSVKSFARHNLN